MSAATLFRILRVAGSPYRTASSTLSLAGLQASQPACAPVARRIEITAVSSLLASPVEGRLFVVLGRSARPEPRTTIGSTGKDAPPVFAMDIGGFDGRRPAILDDRAAAFPVARLSDVPPGEYVAQAVLDTNTDLKSVNAPGNLYSAPTPVRLSVCRVIVQLQLSDGFPTKNCRRRLNYFAGSRFDRPCSPSSTNGPSPSRWCDSAA